MSQQRSEGLPPNRKHAATSAARRHSAAISVALSGTARLPHTRPRRPPSPSAHTVTAAPPR